MRNKIIIFICFGLFLIVSSLFFLNYIHDRSKEIQFKEYNAESVEGKFSNVTCDFNDICEMDKGENETSCFNDCYLNLSCSSDSWGTLAKKESVILIDKDILTGEWTTSIVAEDICKDQDTLLKYRCEFDSNNDFRSEYGNTTGYEINCTYGCLDGACLLGQISDFCSSVGNCIPITSSIDCYGVPFGWNSQTNPYTSGSIAVSNNDNSYTFSDFCIEEGKKISYYCMDYSLTDSQDWRWKNFVIPNLSEISCPNNYRCLNGKCIESDRPAFAAIGDINMDGVIDTNDEEMLSDMLGIGSRGTDYLQNADIDQDYNIDHYDLYRLGGLVSSNIGLNPKYPLRNFSITTGYSLDSTDNANTATLFEQLQNGLQFWTINHQKKGASRSVCAPPVLKVNLRNVIASNRLLGITSLQGFTTLRYDEFRLVPDCDIWGQNKVDNLLREYFIFWLYRKLGMPTTDVIAFAKMKFDSPDTNFDKSKYYNYFFLQKDDSTHDQISFMNQFRFSRLAEASDYYGVDWETSNRLYKINTSKNGITEMFYLDRDNAIRYIILNDLVSLSDRGYFHNEDYGFNSLSQKWHYIPFDFDLSLECSDNMGGEFENYVSRLPPDIAAEYKQRYYEILKEIYDNPNNLNEMLLAIDKFPFESNKIKMKNSIKIRFYKRVLVYGSREFAIRMGQDYIPYTYHDYFTNEVRRLISRNTLDTTCSFEQAKYEFENLLGDTNRIECRRGQTIGDSNDDGTINYQDYNIIERIINGVSGQPQDICCIDVNKDGRVTSSDLVKLNSIIDGAELSPGKCGENNRVCKDFDIEDNVKEFGKLEYNGLSYEDKCEESGLSVRQYFCDDDKLRSFVKRCPAGTECNKGMCL